jgi:2-oxoisovalerate dehydrogenase E1 component
MRANLREPRTLELRQAWEAKDPLVRLELSIRERAPELLPELERIKSLVQSEIEDAIKFAEESPEPDLSMLSGAVCAAHAKPDLVPARTERELTFVEALNEALRQEMERDPNVFLMGEDIAETGGIFQVTKGLSERFGVERVRDTPISEAAFCGAGVGAAIAGMRPVVEVQIFDFVTQMMDMIVNQAAKFRFMNGGTAEVPIVIRGPQGGGIRLAAQHSQSLEAWFSHVPGLVVIAPSTPFDAKGLLAAAIRDPNPVIFLEHKMLYLGQSSPVPEESYVLPIGKADIKLAGTDVTIVATQTMVSRALGAAAVLQREGISVEVIDPRTIRPLDEETIISSVRKTKRLVIAHEAVMFGGFGAEIAALVADKAFDWLDAPIIRIASLDVPMPFNDRLENDVIPSQTRIISEVRDLVAGRR